jgi:hypothetical protein
MGLMAGRAKEDEDDPVCLTKRYRCRGPEIPEKVFLPQAAKQWFLSARTKTQESIDLVISVHSKSSTWRPDSNYEDGLEMKADEAANL